VPSVAAKSDAPLDATIRTMMGKFWRVLFPSLRSAGEAPDHRPLTPRVAADERIYAVGDLHGRADLLRRIMSLIDADAATARMADGRRTRIVFLGDYVDRGDDSRAVLGMLRAIRDERGDAACFLRGNHEAAMLRFLEDPLSGAAWLDFGGRQTLASYGVPVAAAPGPAALLAARDALLLALGPDRSFLEQALLPCVRSGDVIFAHAGLDPTTPPEDQVESTLIWGHPRFLEEGGPPGLLVVHGHFDAPTAQVTPGRICVDTGAYYSGVLTAVRLDAATAFLST
jgi:serine/threonine protein phosphatase 1